MITQKEYLKALNTIKSYHKQSNLSNIELLREKLSPNLNRNDFIKYESGSTSKYLTEGNKYRLTCEPYKNRVCIINDGGKRMNTNVLYFKNA